MAQSPQLGTEATMMTKLSLVSTLILMGSASAFAQSATKPTTPEPTSKIVATDAEGRTLIGEQLQYNPNVSAADGDPETLYILNEGNVKQSGAWGEADREACKASGGIEVPLPAGRIGCIRL